MNDQCLDSAATEEARVQSAYAKRDPADGRYSWFNPGHLFMMQERERTILALLQRFAITSLHNQRILEVGCGSGYWLRELIKWGARPEHITGVELLPDRVAAARHTCPSGVTVSCGSAAQLSYPDETFDIVIQSTVFTSILAPEMKQRIAAEMVRVLKPDGIILWYDYFLDNPANADVKGVAKREIHQLFPACRITLRRVTLAPPLVRFLAPYSWLLCFWLSHIPLLCTHYVGGIQKGGIGARSVSAIPRSEYC